MPMNAAHYPKDWLSLRKQVLERALHRCECEGQCGSDHLDEMWEPGRCDAPNGKLIQRAKGVLEQWVPVYAIGNTPHHQSPIKVVLTTAHICQESMCNDLAHLLSLCQLCHLRLDAKQHQETRKKNKGQL